MGMSAWGFFVAPLVAYAQGPVPQEPTTSIIEQPLELGDDIFGGLVPMNTGAMSASSGGADTAINIQDIGINMAENTGSVSDVNTTNTETGQIANNVVSDNRGITTVFNNTGNGVIFQSNVNVNVFLNDGGN